MLQGLFRRIVAVAVVAACAMVATVALGAAVYHLLAIWLVPAGAAALTALLFAVTAAGVAVLFLGAGPDDEDEDEDDSSLAGRLLSIVRHRPVLGAVGGLAAAFLVLRNPALAALAASLLSSDPRGESRSRRRARRR